MAETTTSPKRGMASNHGGPIAAAYSTKPTESVFERNFKCRTFWRWGYVKRTLSVSGKVIDLEAELTEKTGGGMQHERLN